MLLFDAMSFSRYFDFSLPFLRSFCLLSLADKLLVTAAVGSSPESTDMMPHFPPSVFVSSLRLPIPCSPFSKDFPAFARLGTVSAPARSIVETIPELVALVLIFLFLLL